MGFQVGCAHRRGRRRGAARCRPAWSRCGQRRRHAVAGGLAQRGAVDGSQRGAVDRRHATAGVDPDPHDPYSGGRVDPGPGGAHAGSRGAHAGGRSGYSSGRSAFAGGRDPHTSALRRGEPQPVAVRNANAGALANALGRREPVTVPHREPVALA